MIRLPYPPSVNAYWRMFARAGSARIYVTHEAQAYKRSCALSAVAQGVRPLDGPVAVELHVFRPRKSGDLDNTLKVLLDALKGVAWEDDRQIISIRAFRFDDAEDPRVEFHACPAKEAPL